MNIQAAKFSFRYSALAIRLFWIDWHRYSCWTRPLPRGPLHLRYCGDTHFWHAGAVIYAEL